jgi:hypothetical protein
VACQAVEGAPGPKRHQSRFSAKVLPECDLRYFSIAKACLSSENAMQVLIVHGV